MAHSIPSAHETRAARTAQNHQQQQAAAAAEAERVTIIATGIRERIRLAIAGAPGSFVALEAMQLEGIPRPAAHDITDEAVQNFLLRQLFWTCRSDAIDIGNTAFEVALRTILQELRTLGYNVSTGKSWVRIEW